MPARKKRPRSTKGHSTALDRPSTVEVPAGVFKDTCLALMDRVQLEGINILITKRGNAVARLVPAESGDHSAMGYMSGTVIAENDIVSADFEAWGEA